MPHQFRRYRACDDITHALRHAMCRAGVPDSERQAFIDWSVGKLWNSFKEERMNHRLIIENEIRQLGLRLPNGTVKKEYSASFRLPMERISDISLVGAEELGLLFKVDSNGECTLKGMPTCAGDFSLRLQYATIEGEPLSELLIPIAFNPDPRSLWRNIPTDPETEFYRPDSDWAYVKVETDGTGGSRKDMVAASLRGRSHAHEGRPRDDHFSLFHCPDSDWYILAVADGAGSARFSRRGAELACDTAVEYCRGRLLDNPSFEKAVMAYAADRNDDAKRVAATRHVIDIVFNGARKAHEAVKKSVEEADAHNATLRDFSTTLMFAICKRYDFGWFIASFWVGDGAMCLYDTSEGTAKLLGTPDEGEFSGQTRFLTMEEIFRDPDVVAKRIRMAIVKDFTALILMTDGVSDPMFETERNLNDIGKWNEFMTKLKEGFPADNIDGVDLSDDNEEAAVQLLRWLDFWSPGNHDDRTIAILC